METLQITKEAAIAAHSDATIKGKQMLENLFGKKTFLQKITDRIKTFDDVIIELGENDKDVIDYRALVSANVSTHIINNQMAVMITKALNEGWVPDWSNGLWDKYFPWFNMNPSGSGFSYYGFADWRTYSYVGSRLCFKSSELAKFAGQTFTEIYEGFMVIKS